MSARTTGRYGFAASCAADESTLIQLTPALDERREPAVTAADIQDRPAQRGAIISCTACGASQARQRSGSES